MGSKKVGNCREPLLWEPIWVAVVTGDGCQGDLIWVAMWICLGCQGDMLGLLGYWGCALTSDGWVSYVCKMRGRGDNRLDET